VSSPFPFNFVSVLFNQPRDLAQLMATEVARSGQLKWLQPVLRIAPTLGNMNVHRLAPIKAEKEESITKQAMKNGRHLLYYILKE
jgi:hypothetical protein